VPFDHYPLWIEAVWQDDDGTVYGWYHHEPDGGCRYKGLRTPDIGALVSTDGGKTFYDFGIVLASGDTPNCDARNGFFAGGHGDFSVILDRNREYFYFLFTNYGGPATSQGVALARMAFGDRANPVGTVHKYYFSGRRRPGIGGQASRNPSGDANWSEPGIGGKVTPVLPAAVSWDQSNTDSHWGPAVHWNTYLARYVILLNRACCKPFWPQEGIYLSYSTDLSDPSTWTEPTKILDSKDIGFAPGYYPQVFGTGPGETDSLVGEVGRLFVKGVSKWELIFSTQEADQQAAPGGDGPGGAFPPSPELMN
jgi:hypothetical protein